MTDQLSLYNNALGHLEEGALASLSEDREPRRHLDVVFAEVVNFCLGEGDWSDFTRSVRLLESNAIATQWGGTAAHRKPDDWVRTVSLSYSPYGLPAADIDDERGVWIARRGDLYVKYVSKDPQWGWSFGDWNPHFTQYVEFELAKKVQPRIRPGNDLKQILAQQTARALFNAQNKNATDKGARTSPLGRLARARGGGGYGRRGERY